MENYISDTGWKIHKYNDNISVECFNPKNAEWRGSFVDSDKNVTNKYPFIREFPYHINILLSNQSRYIDNIRLKEIISEASEKGTFYIDFIYKNNEPIHHHIIDILDHTVKAQIYPTVNVYLEQFNNDLLEFAKVNPCEIGITSYDGFDSIQETFYLLINNNVKTIINLTLNNNTVDSIINILSSNNSYFSSSNFSHLIIYKDIPNNISQEIKEKYDRLNELIQRREDELVVFEKCAKNIQVIHNALKTCIRSRRSLFIDYDLKAKPCKYDYDNKFAIDLNQFTLEEAWNSDQFKSFREQISCEENMTKIDSQNQYLITKCPLLD